MGVLRKLVRILLGLAGLFGAVFVALLVEAHVEMRAVTPPLPTSEAILATGSRDPGAGPIAIRYVESGRQRTAEGGFMTYGGFVLSWADGRIFVVDLGMSEAEMRRFGAAIELALGTAPLEAFGSVAERLGEATSRIEGIGFSHLHTDHTQGAVALCAAAGGRTLPVFQTTDQNERGNYTTDSGRADLERGGCLEPTVLDGDRALRPVPGFSGLAAFAAGGHTPGSTVYVARVGERLFVLAGDVTNEHARLLEDRGKGFFYSYVLIPESTARLGELRRRLAPLHRPPEVEVLVAHDRGAIERAGLLEAP